MAGRPETRRTAVINHDPSASIDGVESRGATVELDDLLPSPRFVEVHRRTVDLPIAVVWPAALTVLTGEVRLMAPFTALRDLPARLRRSRAVGVDHDRTMLAELLHQGFFHARWDDEPTAGRAVVLSCAAGRFWSPTQDAATTLTSVEDFTAHDTPRSARIAASLAAIDRGDHTELVTETRVSGTDAAADRTFRRYWMLIRGPSGLIRRSWLAAIERRARAAAGGT
jgi:hypothetical protein